MSLAEAKCEACTSATKPMSAEEAAQMGKQIPDWTVSDKQIERTFAFSDFIEAVRFGDRVAEIAEQENHHPEMHISWGALRVELSTHKIGGLSKNDFIVAAKIDSIYGAGSESPQAM